MSRTEKRNLFSDLKTVIILIRHQGVVGIIGMQFVRLSVVVSIGPSVHPYACLSPGYN